MKSHGGPNLARGPEFDTHDLDRARRRGPRLQKNTWLSYCFLVILQLLVWVN